MARVVRKRRDGVVEMPQYYDKRLTIVMGAMALAWCVMLPIAFYNTYGSVRGGFEAALDDYDYVFNFEERIRTTYRERWVHSLGDTTTEDEFLAGMQEGHSNRFLATMPFWAFFFGTPIFLLLLISFWPRRCPIRFDRNREIIYTWRGGHVWIADIGPRKGGLKTRLSSGMDGNPVYGTDKGIGPLAIKMHQIDSPTQSREFFAGIYPITHRDQNLDIQMFVNAFMTHAPRDEEGTLYEWDGKWLEKLERGPVFFFDWMRWLSERSFIVERFDEDKTEAALMEYLTHPETRSRGKRVKQ